MYFLGVDRLTERPAVFMLHQHLDDFVTLVKEWALVRHLPFNIALARPTCFFYTRHLAKLKFLLVVEVESLVLEQVVASCVGNQFAHLVHLASDVLVERLVSDMPVNYALHHCASIIIFDVSFPPWLSHKSRRCWLFLKALLSEVLNRVVIGICKEVVYVLFVGVVFKFVH